MPLKWRGHLVTIVWLAVACMPLDRLAQAQQQQFYVNGMPVTETVYQASMFYNDAVALITENRLAEAAAKLEAAIRLAPDFYEAHHNLGLVLFRLGREAAASERFQTVVVARADLPNAWVSLGAIHINAGRHNEAVAIFNDADTRFPQVTWQRIPEFYYNFGVALGQIGRTEEGIEKLQLAVRAKPDLPLAWINLGAFYQANGKLHQSLEHYREFIGRFPNDSNIPVIVDTVKVIEEELRAAAKLRTRSDEDYYAEVALRQPSTWPRSALPLRVHIRSGDGVPGFQNRFIDILKAAFQEWIGAAGGRINLRFVNRPADADIECLWTDNPGQLRNQAEGGEAQLLFQKGLIRKAKIIILTIPRNRPGAITDNAIKSVALHEVGHALGLFGHSPNPQDVMFFSARIKDDEPQLTARDRKTLLRLYSWNKAAK